MESVEAVETFTQNSARFRYRVPVSILRELTYEGSRYSAQFEVGGWFWRFHIQERRVDNVPYLALHLQSCTAGTVPVHFKLSVVCMQDPLLSRSKTFHCTFKKAGSAWGLHQFIEMQTLMEPENGFIYTVEGTNTRCVDFEATLQVQVAGANNQSDGLNGPHNIGNNNISSTMSVTPERYVSPSNSIQRLNRSNENLSGNRRLRSASPGQQGLSQQQQPQGNNRSYSSEIPLNFNYPPPPPASASAVNENNLEAQRNTLTGNRNTNGFNVDQATQRRSSSAQPFLSHPSFRHDNTFNNNNNNNNNVNNNTNISMTPSVYDEQSPARYTTVYADGARASLHFPFEFLESLCDMNFDIQGTRVKAHRCVIGARMKPLLPEAMLPLQPNCIVAIAIPLDVFNTFLRYVYTEEYPETGGLGPESLLDLYLLAAACEFYNLCSVCLQEVGPLLTPDNILPIVLTRYNAADEVLTSLYLTVLLQHYDQLIQDKQFEEIPGHLFRRLSLILYRKESVPHVPIPSAKNTLGRQLAWLAESGEYSDCELIVGSQQFALRAHRYILACRSTVFAAHVNPRLPSSQRALPPLTPPEFDFNLRCWQKLLTGMYRHHLITNRDFNAEDIAIVYKMHATWGLDGHLKREADEAFNATNALRILIYAVKHGISELHERAVFHVASNFKELIRNDPQAWELIGELPQSAVVSLFKLVTENMPSENERLLE